MFIDTDTVADVRDIVADQLNRAANRINSDIAAHKRGNTATVPKSQIRRGAIVLEGYIGVYNAVFHYGEAEGYDHTLLDKANAARQDAAALYGKETL